MILLVLVALLLTGCASSFEKRYTDDCVMTQADTQGPGVTASSWPCKIQHFDKVP